MVAPSGRVTSTYSRAVTDVVTLALRDLVQLINSSQGGPVGLKRDLQEYFPSIADQYGAVAADLAAEYYQEARLSAGATSRFVAQPTVWKVTPERIESLISWGIAPAFGQSEATVASLIGGGLQRIVHSGFRGTVAGNVARDRVAYGYARKPRPGCCAFCAMLGTRVYSSEESASTVTGRQYSARGLRRPARGEYVTRTRGKRSLGESFHDFCRCETVPVFRESGNQYADEWNDIQNVNPDAAQYVEAYTAARNAGDGSTTDVLARMRSEHGFKR